MGDQKHLSIYSLSIKTSNNCLAHLHPEVYTIQRSVHNHVYIMAINLSVCRAISSSGRAFCNIGQSLSAPETAGPIYQYATFLVFGTELYPPEYRLEIFILFMLT